MAANFSPNMIKTYQTCPKKYYFQYLENINMPKSSIPYEKGKKIHALANYYLQNIKIDKIETVLNEHERADWELLKENSFYNMNCIKSEFTLSIKLTPNPEIKEADNQFWLGGRLDALVNKDNNYYILDYKTGSIPEKSEFDPQTMIYLLCADRYLKNYNKLFFVYIDLKNKRNYVIEFTQDLKSKYETELIKICSQISSDKLYKCSKNSCKFCEYNKICV